MCDSFSSSVLNHRTDEYGGSAENRARFAVEAVRAVYRQSSEILIDYKLTVRQAIPLYGSADVVESEPGIFVPILVEASVTSFHVTLAVGSAVEAEPPHAAKDRVIAAAIPAARTRCFAFICFAPYDILSRLIY